MSNFFVYQTPSYVKVENKTNIEYLRKWLRTFWILERNSWRIISMRIWMQIDKIDLQKYSNISTYLIIMFNMKRLKRIKTFPDLLEEKIPFKRFVSIPYLKKNIGMNFITMLMFIRPMIFVAQRTQCKLHNVFHMNIKTSF